MLCFKFSCENFRWKDDRDRHEEGVVPKPHDINAPGEMGKPVKIENPDPDVKKIIDEGKNFTFRKHLFLSTEFLNRICENFEF